MAEGARAMLSAAMPDAVGRTRCQARRCQTLWGARDAVRARVAHAPLDDVAKLGVSRLSDHLNRTLEGARRALAASPARVSRTNGRPHGQLRADATRQQHAPQRHVGEADEIVA